MNIMEWNVTQPRETNEKDSPSYDGFFIRFNITSISLCCKNVKMLINKNEKVKQLNEFHLHLLMIACPRPSSTLLIAIRGGH
jgi:hypothetical protein